jgi:pheromone shutdown protein TraB
MSGEPFFSSLIMVGTVHRDPKGFGKLLRILEREAPDFITVEISPYALEFREKQASHFRAILRENLQKIQREEGESYRRFLSHGEIQGIFLLLKVPFEWKAAKEYARRSRIGLKAIDLSTYSEEKLARISELIQIENLRALLQSSSPAIIDQVIFQNRRAQNLWNQPLASGSPQEEIQERERHMAGEICRVMAEGNKRKILHVGGWEHLLPASQGKSLFTRLENLNPRRLLLSDGE